MILAMLDVLLLSAIGGLAASLVFAAKDWHEEALRDKITLACCCAAALGVSFVIVVLPLVDGPDILAQLLRGRGHGLRGTAALVLALGSGLVGLAAPFTRVRSGYVLLIPGLILAGLWLLMASISALP